MKFIAILCLLLSIISCQETKKGVNEFEVDITSRQLRNIVTEYNQKNLNGKERAVITLVIDNKSDTTTLFISSLLEPDQTFAKNNLPSFFTLIDKRPILIYTGFENFMSFSETYVKEFEEIMNGYWIDSNFEEGEDRIIPPNYNPIVWRIKFFNRKLIERIDLDTEKI